MKWHERRERSPIQGGDTERLTRLFSATLAFTSESPTDAVVTAEGRDGAYIGSGDGAGRCGGLRQRSDPDFEGNRTPGSRIALSWRVNLESPTPSTLSDPDDLIPLDSTRAYFFLGSSAGLT